MNIFDESPGLGSRLRNLRTGLAALLGEEMLHHLHQRTIAAHEVDCVRLVLTGVSKTQTDKSFSRSRHAGEKANDVPSLSAGAIDDILNSGCDHLDFVLRGFGMRDLPNRQSGP